MASPKVSWQQCRYPRRWNMRPLPGGEILTKKKVSTPRSFIYDICFGICKHGKFAPYKAKEPRSPSVTECSNHTTKSQKEKKTKQVMKCLLLTCRSSKLHSQGKTFKHTQLSKLQKSTKLIKMS